MSRQARLACGPLPVAAAAAASASGRLPRLTAHETARLAPCGLWRCRRAGWQACRGAGCRPAAALSVARDGALGAQACVGGGARALGAQACGRR